MPFNTKTSKLKVITQLYGKR